MRVAFGQSTPNVGDLADVTETKESPSGRSYDAIKPAMRPQFLGILEMTAITGEADKIDGVEIYEVAIGASGKPTAELVASNDAPVLALVKTDESPNTLLLFGERIDQVLDVADGLPAGEMAFLRDSERPSRVMPVVVGLTVAAAAVGGVMYLGRRR